MFFLEITEHNAVKIDNFCAKFVSDDGCSTSQEADELLAMMLKSFRIHKHKKPADPEITKQLAKILSQIYRKANATEVRANARS